MTLPLKLRTPKSRNLGDRSSPDGFRSISTWQGEMHRRAPIQRALHPDPATLSVNRQPAEGEAETRPPFGSFRLAERFKKGFHVVGRNPGSVILNRDLDPPVPGIRYRHLDLRPRRTELERVREKVDDDSPGQLRVQIALIDVDVAHQSDVVALGPEGDLLEAVRNHRVQCDP